MIEKNIYRVTCDVKNCNNLAHYIFSAKGRMGRFYICKSCLGTLACDYQMLTTPKSPQNAIKKVLDNKNQTIGTLD